MPVGVPLDLTGQRFGKWTVLSKIGPERSKMYWRCRCVCGQLGSVQASNLRSGMSTQCRICASINFKMSRTTKPLLLIDVDGPLNPYANSNNQLRKGKEFRLHRLHGFKVWLNRWHGEQLLALAEHFVLVWATTWEHDANNMIGPKIGLPERLPVIEWDKTRVGSDDGTYFKTHEIVTWAAGRPFAWVDDEISVRDEKYVATHHPGPARLLWVNPAAGLRQPDFDALASWAASLKEVSDTQHTGGT